MPKIVIAVILVVVVVAAAVLAVIRIRNLEHTGEQAKQHLSTLAVKNAENEAIVGNLRDSLTMMRRNVESANQELSRVREHETLKQNVFREGCKIIDSVLREYDRNTFSKMTPEEAGTFTEKMIVLINDLKDKIEKYNSSPGVASLPAEDRERIRMDLYNYEAVKVAEYQEKWQKKLSQ